MPSATPFPPGPSHLALFGAEDLLRLDGCPVCRYVAEANDRFLGWFALETHADADMITQMCGSLGFCPRHTRGILGQPGAAGRMTALYTYLLRAAARFLADGTVPWRPCLPCTRDAEATDRALDTLLAALRQEDLRDRYRASHSLCLPHLRAAVPRAERKLSAWLAGDILSRLTARLPSAALLTGDRDSDAEVRARLRTSLTAAAFASAGRVCAACRTVCLRERDAIGLWANAAQPSSDSTPGLCPAHLRDACAGPAGSRLLALETERAEAWLAKLMPAGRDSPFRRLAVKRARGHSGQRQGKCPGCSPNDTMARAAQARHATVPPGQEPELCLRHLLALRRREPRVAAPLVRAAVSSTESVLADLEQRFRDRARTHRHDLPGRHMAPWQRAVVLIDGTVYGGGPPVPLSPFPYLGPWQAHRLPGQQEER